MSEDCTLYWTKGIVAACETSCPFQNPSKISSIMQCDVLHNLNLKAATATPLLDAISLFRILSIYDISLQFHYDVITISLRPLMSLGFSTIKTARRP